MPSAMNNTRITDGPRLGLADSFSQASHYVYGLTKEEKAIVQGAAK
jgi:hypothetical protein